MKKYRSKANANIALIKYWGKKNEEEIIPYTSSLSLSLDALYTITEVSFIDEDSDVFYLDQEVQDQKETQKISIFIDQFRKISGSDKRVLVESQNYFPTAAGLASSASGYAALATGLNKLFETNLDKKELSKLTRRGSGSATRSIYGGIAEWQKGHDHDSSFAKKIDQGDWDLAMVIIVVNKNKKEISSRDAMKLTVDSSPLYDAYVEHSAKDLDAIKEAIKNRDFKTMGEITEHNGMQMHATIISTKPPIIYFEEETMKAIGKVRDLRQMGYDAYFTMDAGPNVKILTRRSQADEIVEILKKDFDKDQLMISDIAQEDSSVEEVK